MSIVLAALAPHSPLLLPTTDKSHKKALNRLLEAYKSLGQLIHAVKPDVILCFNPHATSVSNVYTFNLAEKFKATFPEFGDLVTIAEALGSPTFTHHLKEHLEANWPVSSIIKEEINYGAGIPILTLSSLPDKLRYSIISSRKAELAEHFNFGIKLQSEIINSEKRVVVLASGDVASGISEAAARGKIPGSEEYYQDWDLAFKKNEIVKFLHDAKKTQVDKFCSCGAYSLSMLLGTINSINTEFTTLYQEVLFGVGYQLSIWQPK